VRCGGYFCASCASPTLDPPPEQGYGACAPCSAQLPPHIWNPHSAGRQDNPGEHLVDALLRPGKASVRAAFGEVPAGSLMAVNALGACGLGWAAAALSLGGTAFERAVFGTLWGGPALAALFAVATVLHLLQPGGEAGPRYRQSLLVVGTAWVWPAVLAALAGATGLYLSAWSEGRTPGLVASAAGAGLYLGGLFSAGIGLGRRRGANAGSAVLIVLGTIAVSALLGGLLALVMTHPPWEPAVDWRPW
jgi:hypothetical protein